MTMRQYFGIFSEMLASEVNVMSLIHVYFGSTVLKLGCLRRLRVVIVIPMYDFEVSFFSINVS